MKRNRQVNLLPFVVTATFMLVVWLLTQLTAPL